MIWRYISIIKSLNHKSHIFTLDNIPKPKEKVSIKKRVKERSVVKRNNNQTNNKTQVQSKEGAETIKQLKKRLSYNKIGTSDYIIQRNIDTVFRWKEIKKQQVEDIRKLLPERVYFNSLLYQFRSKSYNSTRTNKYGETIEKRLEYQKRYFLNKFHIF